MITLKELRQIEIFQDVSAEIMEQMKPFLDVKSFAAEEMIFFRGDPGHSLFMILQGKVSVTLTNAEGMEYTITTLVQGNVFGEMALITGEPRSTNVRSLTEVTVIEVNQHGFQELCRIFPEINTRLFRLVAKRLGRGTVREAERLEAKDILTNLLSSQQLPEFDHFPGTTKWSQQVNESIRQISAADSHVLLIGRTGSGKELTAKLIHQKSNRHGHPILSYDCANTPPVLRVAPELKPETADQLLLEASQEAALFGHEAGSAVYAKGTRRGYVEVADKGTLLLLRIEYLTLKVQQLLSEFLKKGTFSRIGEKDVLSSDVRVIATAMENIDELADKGLFNRELYQQISGKIIRLVPLSERKKDIPVLADLYLNLFSKNAHKTIHGFSKNAVNALIDYSWPSNITELRQVIERAVAICEADEIHEEHIFLDITPFSTVGKFNVLRLESIWNLAQHRLFPKALVYLTIPFFIFLTLYTLIGPQTENVANLIAWSLLWPFMIFSVAVSGRIWCTFCPMSGTANALVWRRKKFLKVPHAVKKYGIWFGIIGFVSIIWAEHITHMTHNPRATGILLLSITGGAILATLVFGRRIWCLYLCPLGAMISEFAAVSLLELRSNSNVCLSQCQTHDCIKDRTCPMGLHPSSEKTTHDCILCLTCIKKCPHKSVHLDVLLPRRRIVYMQKWELQRSLFAVLLVASVIAIKLPLWIGEHIAFPLRNLGVGNTYPWMNLIEYVFILGAFSGVVFLPSIVFKRQGWSFQFNHVGYAYLPLALAGVFNSYFRELIDNGHRIPPLLIQIFGLERFVNPLQITPDLATLKALIPLIVFVSTLSSLYFLKGIVKKFDIEKPAKKFHQAVIIMTGLIFLLIL